MIITNYGKQFFKVQFGDTVIAFNPISKESKLKSSKFGADVAIVSLNSPDFNGIESVTYGGNKPFVISGPGEYETKGIFIKGFLSNNTMGGEDLINTIYLVSIEDMNLCFLGSLQNFDIEAKTKEALENIDILFVPINSKETLSPDEAYKIATKLGAGIVIPMDYDSESLKQFLKESSSENTSSVDKLTIKKRDLDGKNAEIVVLKSNS
jgi:hypothetical protein